MLGRGLRSSAEEEPPQPVAVTPAATSDKVRRTFTRITADLRVAQPVDRCRSSSSQRSDCSHDLKEESSDRRPSIAASSQKNGKRAEQEAANAVTAPLPEIAEVTQSAPRTSA